MDFGEQNDLLVHCKIHSEITTYRYRKILFVVQADLMLHEMSSNIYSFEFNTVIWIKKILNFFLADFLFFLFFRIPQFKQLIQVLQLDFCIISNFPFLIEGAHIQIKELCAVSPTLFCQSYSCQMQSCILEYFLPKMVLGSETIFSHVIQ